MVRSTSTFNHLKALLLEPKELPVAVCRTLLEPFPRIGVAVVAPQALGSGFRLWFHDAGRELVRSDTSLPWQRPCVKAKTVHLQAIPILSTLPNLS